MRARQPDRDGYVERDGVKVFYEVFGAGAPTILLLPTWSVVHSRTWKMQVPYLARHYRVVTFDGRGNGRSDRPAGASSYVAAEYAADALAVMDATGTDRAVVVSLSRGASYSLHLAAGWPRRVAGQVFLCPTTPLAPFSPVRLPYARRFEEASRQRRGLGQGQRRLLAARLPRVPGVLLRPGLRRAPLDQAHRGRHRMGTRDHAGDAHRHAPGRRCSTQIATSHRCSTGCEARAWSSREAKTRSSDPAPVPGWPTPWATGPGSSSWPGRATAPMPATRSRSTCSSATS